MHSFSRRLPWFKQEGVMLETKFPILQDFYQWNMVKESDHTVNYDTKFGFPTRSINRGIYNVKAGLPCWLKIWSINWKKPLKYSKRYHLFSLVHQSQFSQDYCRWPFPALYRSHFMDSCCLWGDEYSSTTNPHVQPLFQLKQSSRNSFWRFFFKFYQIYWTPC